MWIAIGIGAVVLVAAVSFAVVPLLAGSVRYHQRLHAKQQRSQRPRRPVRLRADCPVCAATVEATGQAALVRAKNRHMFRRHTPDGVATPLGDATERVSRSA